MISQADVQWFKPIAWSWQFWNCTLEKLSFSCVAEQLKKQRKLSFFLCCLLSRQHRPSLAPNSNHGYLGRFFVASFAHLIVTHIFILALFSFARWSSPSHSLSHCKHPSSPPNPLQTPTNYIPWEWFPYFYPIRVFSIFLYDLEKIKLKCCIKNEMGVELTWTDCTSESEVRTRTGGDCTGESSNLKAP